MNRRGMKKGFTLIELILSAAIASVISLAVYSTFSTGINVWRRACGVGVQDRKRFLRVEKFKKDLRQTFVFRGNEIPFLGNRTSVSFPIVQDAAIKSLAYSFDPGGKALKRGSLGIERILDAKSNETSAPLRPAQAVFMDGVEDLRFSFFYFDAAKNTGHWNDTWNDPAGLPAAVKFTVTFTNNETLNEIVFVPAA